MAARGHFVFPIDDKNHRVLVIWDGGGDGGGGANKTIISPKFSNFGDIITYIQHSIYTSYIDMWCLWGKIKILNKKAFYHCIEIGV